MFSYSSPFLTWTSIILVKVFETDISQNNFKDFFFLERWHDMHACKKNQAVKNCMVKTWLLYVPDSGYLFTWIHFRFINTIVNYGWIINHLREKKMHHHIFYWTKFICYWIFYHLFLSILWISCFRMEICIHHFFFLFHFIINF